jgi:hypothetical protein
VYFDFEQLPAAVQVLCVVKLEFEHAPAELQEVLLLYPLMLHILFATQAAIVV